MTVLFEACIPDEESGRGCLLGEGDFLLKRKAGSLISLPFLILGTAARQFIPCSFSQFEAGIVLPHLSGQFGRP